MESFVRQLGLRVVDFLGWIAETVRGVFSALAEQASFTMFGLALFVVVLTALWALRPR